MRSLALFFGLIAGTVLSVANVQGQVEAPKMIPPTSELDEALLKATKGFKPHRGPPVGAINGNGVYILDGDLFGDGHHYAVIDHDPLLIAEWKAHRWNLKGVLNLGPVWKYPGWDATTAGTREPEATRPFWMITLRNRPLLVVASQVEKAGQDYVVLLFNAGLNGLLDFDSSLQVSPATEEEYLHTHDSSRVKSEWSLDDFSTIETNKFVVAKSWREYDPYNQPDPSDYEGSVYCYGASSGTSAYTITPDFRGKSSADKYLVFRGALRFSGWREILDAWKKNKIFATVTFTPKVDTSQLGSADLPEAEIGYLFEKLTGLPRKLYRLPENIALKKLESLARVRVSGCVDAVRLLSSTPQH